MGNSEVGISTSARAAWCSRSSRASTAPAPTARWRRNPVLMDAFAAARNRVQRFISWGSSPTAASIPPTCISMRSCVPLAMRGWAYHGSLLHGRARRAAEERCGIRGEELARPCWGRASPTTCAPLRDSQHLGALLRHGPRQPMGARRACVARRLAGRCCCGRPQRRPRSWAALYCGGRTDEFVVPHGALAGAGCTTATPSCSSTSAPTAPARSRARWWTRRSTASGARAFPQVSLRVPHRVRPRDPRAGGLPQGVPRQRAGRRAGGGGPAPVPHRRDREVRPRDVLPERRARGAEGGGGARARPQPQGGHLRPQA